MKIETMRREVKKKEEMKVITLQSRGGSFGSHFSHMVIQDGEVYHRLSKQCVCVACLSGSNPGLWHLIYSPIPC